MNRFLRIACTIRASINPMDWIIHPLRTIRWYRRYRAFLVVAAMFGACGLVEEDTDEESKEESLGITLADQPLRN